ncbi:hypothetical protein [Lacticaseibacillus mingshuiensis]|uniref:hypothetical protein n=1 Tax=Lacticaseibacillus mingshuiensis TaxID=2799574 RepID=UPI001951BAFF|nr:hypothetical protein [Lacticaseibacillus mingshuiensis]
MRFDRTASFYSGEATFDPTSQQYIGGNVSVVTLVANVTPVGTDRQAATFGDIDQSSLTVRLISQPPVDWSYLKLDGDDRHYRQTTRRDLRRTIHTLIVSEEK